MATFNPEEYLKDIESPSGGYFDTAVNNVFTREGGFVPIDANTGQPSNFGINQKANPDIDVANLKKEDAAQLYKDRYWDTIDARKLSPPAAEVAFDAAVNQGPEFAKKIIDQSGGDHNKMIDLRKEKYLKLAEDPKFEQYLPGWLNRLDDVKAKADVAVPPEALKEATLEAPKETPPAEETFDPDAYLASVQPPEFDPDAYLKSLSKPTVQPIDWNAKKPKDIVAAATSAFDVVNPLSLLPMGVDVAAYGVARAAQTLGLNTNAGKTPEDAEKFAQETVHQIGFDVFQDMAGKATGKIESPEYQNETLRKGISTAFDKGSQFISDKTGVPKPDVEKLAQAAMLGYAAKGASGGPKVEPPPDLATIEAPKSLPPPTEPPKTGPAELPPPIEPEKEVKEVGSLSEPIPEPTQEPTVTQEINNAAAGLPPENNLHGQDTTLINDLMNGKEVPPNPIVGNPDLRPSYQTIEPTFNRTTFDSDATKSRELSISLGLDDGKELSTYTPQQIYQEAQYVRSLFDERGTMNNEMLNSNVKEDRATAKREIKSLDNFINKYQDLGAQDLKPSYEKIDQEEKPKTFYHATYSDFDKPIVNHGADEYRRYGFHVGNLEAAENRFGIKENEDLTNREVSGNAAPNIRPVYINIKKPLRLDENRSGRWGVDDIMRAIMEKADTEGVPGISKKMVDDYYDDKLNIDKAIGNKFPYGDRAWNDDQWSDGEKSEALTKFLNSLGYDGIVYKNEFEGGGDSYIALKPNQIKSAIGNKGTYSPEDLRIQHQIIKGNTGTDQSAMVKLLDQQLYGKYSDKAEISLKEMMQNAFDAIKPDLDNGKLKKGRIDVDIDTDDRTIQVKDNGHGMTPKVLQNEFLTIAGTKKESKVTSGSFGVAKVQVLYGSKDINVATMANGKISTMQSTGEALKNSLVDKSLRPDIKILTPEEYGIDNVKRDFPDGHGTILRISLPETYTDIEGEVNEINLWYSPTNYDVIKNSPLRNNIDIYWSGNKIGERDTDPHVGSNFPTKDYETIGHGKYKWGTVHIYAQKNPPSNLDYENFIVLSDGIYQFGESLQKDPKDASKGKIDRKIFIDIQPTHRANEPGYPFRLERQGFTVEAKEDLKNILNFIRERYKNLDYSKESQGFGSIQYLDKKDGNIVQSEKQGLTPPAPEGPKSALSASADLKIEKGKFVPDTDKVPTLSKEQIKASKVNSKEFLIDQNEVNPNRVMFHDNLLVNDKKLNRLFNEIDRLANRMSDEEAELSKIPKYIEGTQEETPEHKAQRNKVNSIYADIQKLENERDALIESPKADNFRPLSEVAREEFDGRFDKFMYDIGDVFRSLRDRVVYLNYKGDLPDFQHNDYKALRKHAVGISFGEGYVGVNVLIPFAGIFVNPVFSQYEGIDAKAVGIFTTMIHELAHYQVRNHGAEWGNEFQRLLTALEVDEDDTANYARKELIKLYKKNEDIINFINKLGIQDDTKSIGASIEVGEQQARDGGNARNVTPAGSEGQGGRKLPKDLTARYQTLKGEPEPEPVPPKGSTPGGVGGGTPPKQPKNFMGEPMDPGSWMQPNRSWTAQGLDSFIRNFANLQRDSELVIRAIEKEFGKLPDNLNWYEKERLMHNITASKIATFKWTKLKPAIDMMIKAKVSPDELNKYMLAKFAPYRNEEVNRLYPNNFDPDGRPFLKDEGSGMKTSEANRYLNSLSPDRKALLESLARPWYKIIDDTLNVAEQSGDIPADAASQLRQQNDKLNQLGQNYVPTQRQFSEAELNSIPLGRSGGINLTGMFGKGFMGSTRAVDSIIKNISNQHIRAIDRGEQNKASNALFAAVLQYPNPDFWTAVFPDAIKDPQAFIQMLNRLGYDVETYENLAEEPKERYIKHLNPRSAAEDDLLRDANGFSVPAPKKVVAAKANIMRRFGPTVISTKFNGRQAYIFFNRNNPMAVEMAKSLKNLDAPKVGMLLRANRSYNSFLGMVNTTLDPAFAVRTLLQHYPFAMANLGATELAKYIPQITADLVPAMAGVLSAVLREEAGIPKDPSSIKMMREWSNWARQAMDNGVILHDRSHMYGDPRQRDITQQIYNKLKTNIAKKTFKTGYESMSKLALVFENAINVATYKAGIDAGLSPQKSAMIALQVMGNLSRKGKYTALTNTLYLFSGVSFNATETFAKTMKNLNKIGAGVVAAYFTIGALQPLLLQSYGIDPADIPEETKQKYFMFPHDDGTITKIGTGWVFRMIPNTGRIAMEYAMEGDNLGKYSTNWLSMMADAATPVGGHFGWRAAVPTTLQMPLSLAINKTPQGTPVSKEERSNKPTTGLSRTSPKAGEISRWIAENINSMTGGDKYKPGAFSPTGDAIEYFFYEGIFGGPGRLEKQISSYSAGEVGGKPVDISQTPVIGAFEMDTTAPSFVSQKFYDNIKEMYLHEEEIKGMQRDNKPVEPYFREHPEARVWHLAESVLSAINQENAKRNKIMALDLPRDQRDKRLSVIENRKTRIMENFNERIKRLKKKE